MILSIMQQAGSPAFGKIYAASIERQTACNLKSLSNNFMIEYPFFTDDSKKMKKICKDYDNATFQDMQNAWEEYDLNKKHLPKQINGDEYLKIYYFTGKDKEKYTKLLANALAQSGKNKFEKTKKNLLKNYTCLKLEETNQEIPAQSLFSKIKKMVPGKNTDRITPKSLEQYFDAKILDVTLDAKAHENVFGSFVKKVAKNAEKTDFVVRTNSPNSVSISKSLNQFKKICD